MARKQYSRRELPNKAWWRRISYDLRRGGGVLISGKLKLQFACGRQKEADYLKMLNDLSLTQEGRRQCGEEWIFQ